MNYLRSGIGSSHRAIAAEEGGRVPESKINTLLDYYPIFAKVFKTKKDAKTWIKSRHDGEWHHTSKYGNKTFFYDVSGLAEELQDFLDGETDYVEGLFYVKEYNPPQPRKNYPNLSPKSASVSAAIFEVENQNYIMPVFPKWVYDLNDVYFNNGYLRFYPHDDRAIGLERYRKLNLIPVGKLSYRGSSARIAYFEYKLKRI